MKAIKQLTEKTVVGSDESLIWKRLGKIGVTWSGLPHEHSPHWHTPRLLHSWLAKVLM